MLPELISLLSSSPREMGVSDDTLATACSTVQNLMLANPEVSRKFINSELVSSLADLNENGWVFTYRGMKKEGKYLCFF